MNFANVKVQLEGVFSRAIETGVSVKQNFPIVSDSGDVKTLGDLKNSTVALKNIPYKDIYLELEQNEQYHIKLPDGGLLIFQYMFRGDGLLRKHRLGYFPSPALPSIEEAPELYQKDELYGDIILNKIVRFPIRFDFDPDNYKPKVHPHSHLTLGQFENCRIPVTHPVSPNNFLRFILRNFYYLLYRKHLNMFEKHMSPCVGVRCITESESVLPYISF